jgi:HAD superfamily hydrolase (TIGR01509 family)
MIKDIPLIPHVSDASPHEHEAPASARHPQSRPWPRGVLLDVDGTLLDSNGAHTHSWLEALLGEGIAVPYEMVRREIGKGGDKLLWDVLKIEEKSVLGQTISRHREAIFKSRYLPDLVAFPQTRSLLQRMLSRGLILEVATASSTAQVDDLLTSAGVFDLVHGVTTKDDAARSKPDPDIIEAAIARSGLTKADLVMLGDTPYDVESATRAGIPTVAFRCGGWDDHDLRGAIAIYDNAADLLNAWESSPFMTGVETEGIRRSG